MQLCNTPLNVKMQAPAFYISLFLFPVQQSSCWEKKQHSLPVSCDIAHVRKRSMLVREDSRVTEELFSPLPSVQQQPGKGGGGGWPASILAPWLQPALLRGLLCQKAGWGSRTCSCCDWLSHDLETADYQPPVTGARAHRALSLSTSLLALLHTCLLCAKAAYLRTLGAKRLKGH